MDDRRVRVATKSPFEEREQRENAKERYFGERAVAELRVLQARHAQLLMQQQKERAQAVKKQEEYALSMTLMTDTLDQLQPGGDWRSQVRELQTRVWVDRQADAAQQHSYREQLVKKDRHITLLRAVAIGQADTGGVLYFRETLNFKDGFPYDLDTKSLIESHDPDARIPEREQLLGFRADFNFMSMIENGRKTATVRVGKKAIAGLKEGTAAWGRIGAGTGVKNILLLIRKISFATIGTVDDEVLRKEGLPVGSLGRAILRRILISCLGNKLKWLRNDAAVSIVEFEQI